MEPFLRAEVTLPESRMAAIAKRLISGQLDASLQALFDLLDVADMASD